MYSTVDGCCVMYCNLFILKVFVMFVCEKKGKIPVCGPGSVGDKKK